MSVSEPPSVHSALTLPTPGITRKLSAAERVIFFTLSPSIYTESSFEPSTHMPFTSDSTPPGAARSGRLNENAVSISPSGRTPPAAFSARRHLSRAAACAAISSAVWFPLLFSCNYTSFRFAPRRITRYLSTCASSAASRCPTSGISYRFPSTSIMQTRSPPVCRSVS